MRLRRETAWPTQSRLSIIAYFPLFPMWPHLQEVRKPNAQRGQGQEGVGPQRVARESPRERLCWRGTEEERSQEHKENSRGKKSPSQLSGDHKRAGPGTVHGCAVLTQRLWRQHLKHRNYCGLSDCITPSSGVDILTHQLTVLEGGRALGGTRTPAEPS